MDIFAPSAAPVLALLGFRLGGLVLIAPVFSSRTVPNMLKAGIIVLLATLLHPVAMASAAQGVRITPAVAMTETLIGFSIGLGVALMVGAAEAMGDLLAVQIGVSGAAALDPLTSHSVPVLGTFASLFAITLLLSLDAHLVMLGAVGDSLSLLPIGVPLDLRAGLATMAGWGSMLFLLGVRFAAPVIATVLLANVALAVLGRAAPQLNVLAVAFPIQIGIGLLVFAASIPLIGAFFNGWATVHDSMLGQVLEAFAPAGRS
ncbi:MAG: flagellar biosynthetic protein FliR [Gemmatimonadota bacterium]